MTFRILQGDNRDVLKTIESNTIDAIVTDPPYGIDFLDKEWDANTGALETYQECLRVLKPGGHILAFSAPRTYHHLAITLEQAGFEIRDQIMWIYSSGFPKSQDVGRSIQRSLGVKEKKKIQNTTLRSKQKLLDHNNITENIYANGTEQVVVTDPKAKQWEGWGTSLKPSHEPICMARKPTKLSIAQNVQKWGTGALNIDAARIPYVDEKDIKSAQFGRPSDDNYQYMNTEAQKTRDNNNVVEANQLGRFPSNVLGEIPNYQKYFYCPKVNRKERHMGFDTTEIPTDSSGHQGSSNGGNYIEKKQGIISNDEMLAKMGGHWLDGNGNQVGSERDGSKMLWLPHTGAIFTHGLKHEYEKWCKANNVALGNVGNNHPTVKPVELMKYLIKLITPPGGTVLDPFNGSGSTGMAAVELGHPYIGIELDPNYVKIAEQRISAWANKDMANNTFEELFEEDASE